MGKADDLKTEMLQQIEAIINAADEARRGAAFQAWLKSAARFHKYSAGNALLIAFQRRDATRVAGYRKWQTMGRQVRKGEKGISILAPVPLLSDHTDDDTGDTRKVQVGVRFRGATVFDISQTDGDPLPDAPDWQGTGRQAELEAAMLDYAHAIGLETKEYTYTGGAAGWYTPGLLAYSDGGNVPRTIAHELAHALTPGQPLELGKRANEPITDLAAAIVCAHFGIDVSDSTANYVAAYTADPRQLLQLAERARRTAAEIIDNVETRLTAENNRH